MSLCPSFRIETAGTEEDVHHVVAALIERLLLVFVLTFVVLAVLLKISVAITVGVPYLIDGITASLTGTLTEIERCQSIGRVAEQGIAKYKHLVHVLIATGGQGGAESILSLVFTFYRVHRSRSSFHPYELPVVIQVITQELTIAKSRIAEGTLCLCLKRQE